MPTMFIGSTVAPKAKMDARTSTGRRNVRIMLCVTGEVLDRIRIDAQLKNQTSMPTIRTTYEAWSTSMPMLSPSTLSAIGIPRTKAPQCSMAMKFSGARWDAVPEASMSLIMSSMKLLLRTVRSATATLEIMALQKPRCVKSASVLAATPTPSTTSSRLTQLLRGILEVVIISRAVMKGSADLIVCTKAMLTSHTEMLANAMHIQCRHTSGSSLTAVRLVNLGGGPAKRSIHIIMQHREHVPKLIAVTVSGAL
mmetsp:Transcript_20433/g.45078  ORF Transcript_20433/g.45078 Transcript_20433/m.45078 type:complete len:253 (-) Transcript_20433:73-831(-)